MKQNQDIAQAYLKRLTALKSERSSFEPDWLDIEANIAPRTLRMPGQQVNNGARRDLKIINTTTRLSARTLSTGMQSGMGNSTTPWIKLGFEDLKLQNAENVKIWLEQTERAMLAYLAKTNYYDRSKSFYGTSGNYGTAVMFMDDDVERILRFHDLAMGSFYIACNAAGVVDTLFREITFTARNLAQRKKERGWKIPKQAQEAYDKGDYEQRFSFCHVAEPNEHYRQGNQPAQYKKWGSIWLDSGKTGTEAVVGIEGYDQQPFSSLRWDVLGEDTWGTGCGDVALGDARGMQVLEKKSYKAIDKNIDPPMVADASVRNQRASYLPGATSYSSGLIATGNPAFKPMYQINPSVSELEEKQRQVEGRYKEAYHTDLFRVILDVAQDPRMTATQIQAMQQEKLALLGPVVERGHTEHLPVVIDRLFSAMFLRGLIPPPPEEIQGQPIKVEFISVLAQAQKASGIGNIERFTTFMGKSILPIYPQGADKVDFDEIIEQYADGLAIGPTAINGDEETLAIRQARAQAQAQAAQQQQDMHEAEIARTDAEAERAATQARTA